MCIECVHAAQLAIVGAGALLPLAWSKFKARRSCSTIGCKRKSLCWNMGSFRREMEAPRPKK